MTLRGKLGTTLIGLALIVSVVPQAQADGYTLTPLVSSPLPVNLSPSLDNAKNDRPTPYKDRCHVQQNLVTTKSSCTYGNLHSSKTIVLFGDSHAMTTVDKYKANNFEEKTFETTLKDSC